MADPLRNRKVYGVGWAILLVLFLSGCSGAVGPFVRIFDGTNPPPRGAVQTLNATTHVVRSGDTLYGISRAYGVPLRSLIEINRLSPPYTLEIGRRLSVPATRTYTVRRGDTVSKIAREQGVSLNALVRANGISPPYLIRVGDILSVPASTTGQVASAVPPTRPPNTTSALPRPPAKPAPPNSSGQSASPQSSPSNPVPDVPPAPQEDVAYANGLIFPPGKPTPPPRMVGAIPVPPARSGDGFLWPVQGSILSGFGPKSQGLHNDGINIAAPRSSPVRAAESGVVAYADNGLAGFGNTILIKHADGYVTAYAHADAMLVQRGDVVQRGQAIARVGSTGNVDRPQLHFQVRRNGDPIDPRRFLLAS